MVSATEHKALKPCRKRYGNDLWVTHGVITALPEEICSDVQQLLVHLNEQSRDINEDSTLVLRLSPVAKYVVIAISSFQVSVLELLKRFPNLKIVDAQTDRYGELVQLSCDGRRDVEPVRLFGAF